jgi:diaminopimelate decarboxylase
VAPVPPTLLPDTAEVSAAGHLSLGGCDVLELAAAFGTPLFVYDESHLRARAREAVAAFGAGHVVYATKAFLCLAMARLAHEEGLLLDVATGGEMHVALAAGVPADRLVVHGNNKSGFGLAGGIADAAVARAAASRSVELVGLHAHIGSQIFAAESFALAAEVMAALTERHELPAVTLGGGLGVAYVEGESAPTITEWGKAVREALDRVGFAGDLYVEPGRALVAAAAVTLYTVGTVKDIPGTRTYVAVDGGMSDNPRPVLYGSGYEAFLPRATNAERRRPVRIVGKHCESGDVLVHEAFVPEDLEVGDVLCTPVTGAYGHSMGSNYNKVPRPAVVFVNDGEARVVVRRETYEDLSRLDVL